MKKKDKAVFNFILKEVGIEITPLLESLIYNPQKIETLNNIALEQIVKEFVPIQKNTSTFLTVGENYVLSPFFAYHLCAD